MLETILPSPVDRAALFIDMDSFFASVEQELHPDWRGRPVGVCPFVHNATCVIAASAEAKRHGVRTGTNIGEARQRCPEIILVPGNSSAYRDYHRQIMAKLEQTRCKVFIRSIDEAYLRPPADLRAEAQELAQQVKLLVREVGSQLSSSVGIGPNLFLAKLATTLQKPDGLVELHLDDLEGTYSMLELRDLPGIGWRLEKRLREASINSPLELYQASFSLLKSLFGQTGVSWHLRLRGYEVDLIPTHRRMIGHQTTIHPQPATTRAELLSVISQLALRIATRLESSGLAGQVILLQFRFADRTYWRRIHRGHIPFFDYPTLWHHLRQLIPSELPQPVRFATISVLNLSPITTLTRQLWDETSLAESLMRAITTLNRRYGNHTIQPARHLRGTVISNQVGFGNAPQAATELS